MKNYTDKIIIKRNPNGDTRTASKKVTFKQFQKANDLHREDVKQVMKVLGRTLEFNGYMHDVTKKMFERKFYTDFVDTLNNGTDFVKGKWYQLHIDHEKHHPTSKLHDDYNLLDLIETVVDCTVAGLARSGEVRPLEIDDEIIKLAIDNTVKLIKDMVIVD